MLQCIWFLLGSRSWWLAFIRLNCTKVVDLIDEISSCVNLIGLLLNRSIDYTPLRFFVFIHKMSGFELSSLIIELIDKQQIISVDIFKGYLSFLVRICHQRKRTFVNVILLESVNRITIVVLGLNNHETWLFLKLKKFLVANKGSILHDDYLLILFYFWRR